MRTLLRVAKLALIAIVVFAIAGIGIVTFSPDARISAAFALKQHGPCELGVSMMRELAENGDPEAQYYYAWWQIFTCDGIKENKVQLVEWLRKASAGGYVHAQTDLAMSLLFGPRPEELGDRNTVQSEGLSWLKKAAEAGDPEAEFFYGDRLWNDAFFLTQEQEKTAAKKEGQRWMQKSSDHGFAEAQYAIGGMLMDGNLENGEDPIEAARLLRLAALQDIGSVVNWSSISKLKELEGSGRGPWRNRAEFAALIEEIANLGDAGSQLYLAELYEKGDGVPQDIDHAIAWYAIAAEGKCKGVEECETDYVPGVTAMYRLANRYLDGDGVAPDGQKAVELLTKAAKLKHPDSQFLLGELYRDGRNVEANRVQALFWFSLAASTDSRLTNDDKRWNALHERDAMRRVMSSAEIAEADKLLAQ